MAETKTNATVSAPGYGSADLYVTELWINAGLASSQTESRNNSTIYPKFRSGGWGIEVIFTSQFSYGFFNYWLAQYMAAITNPYKPTPQPMTISVPSRSFVKTGFPEFAAEFGDDQQKFTWTMRMEFSSASESADPARVSKFVSATNNQNATYFYPGGTQLAELQNPISDPFADIEPNEPYDKPSSGLLRRS